MFIAATLAILVTIALTLWRAFIGPTLFDRLLAVNSVGTKTVMLIAVYGFMMGRPDFLDIALVYSLINFLGTVAVLKFFEYEDLGSGAYQEDDY
jgi:multicomponent Na+:H+ antiporter subunit F